MESLFSCVARGVQNRRTPRGKNVNSMVTVLEIFAALRAVKAGARCQVAAAKKNSPRFAREGCDIICVKLIFTNDENDVNSL